MGQRVVLALTQTLFQGKSFSFGEVSTEINMVVPSVDIPAPDIGTDGKQWHGSYTYSQLKGYTVPGVVTGKPISVGGSLGRAEETGKGVALRSFAADYIKYKIDETTKVAVHGFGKVGIPAAQDLVAQGAKVVAISDVSGYIRSKGIDIGKAAEWTKDGKLLKDFAPTKQLLMKNYLN